MIAALESGLQRVPEEDAVLARLRIVSILSQARPPSSNLSASRAIKQLQGDDDILIIPADKGRATVVMKRREYEQKVQQTQQ